MGGTAPIHFPFVLVTGNVSYCNQTKNRGQIPTGTSLFGPGLQSRERTPSLTRLQGTFGPGHGSPGQVPVWLQATRGRMWVCAHCCESESDLARRLTPPRSVGFAIKTRLEEESVTENTIIYVGSVENDVYSVAK